MFIYFLLLLAKSPAIKIGVQFPLSGPISDYGIYCLQGVKLAFSDHPEISLVVRDNEGKAEICTEILHEFAGMGVCAVIGPVISPNAIIVGLEATKFGIPIILPAATNTAVTKVSDFLFRVCYTDEQQAEAIAKFTFFTLKRSKVAIISDTSNIYSIGLALYFRYYFESIGGKAHIIKWNGTSNLSDTLQNLIGSTIFLPLYYKPASDIIKFVKELMD
ncbi:MAG: ABC transporter substrate-binding protein [Candidatus Stahlbacteria bacterium]|nr:ABC transporter substrate-binding protein [Candidatus Stahlbacteria bacterium]